MGDRIAVALSRYVSRASSSAPRGLVFRAPAALAF